jgi:hypothetical protein
MSTKSGFPTSRGDLDNEVRSFVISRRFGPHKFRRLPPLPHRDGEVLASCGCCNEATPLKVKDGKLRPGEGLIHIALPARRRYEVFT